MRWQDRVYGEVAIEEPAILDLIGCPTFQRLKGVRQAGPSALAFPFKDVTRFEHSLGVFLLLRRLGAVAANRSPACCTTSRIRRSRTRSISLSRRRSRTITSSSSR